MHRRISTSVLLLIALSWVAEPAYALWNFASEHACCVPKAAAPSCHGMEHHDPGASVAAGHQHSGCTHDCCTKLRTASGSALTVTAVPHRFPDSAQLIASRAIDTPLSAGRIPAFERGPPTLS